MTAAWDQLPGETAKAYAAFCLYRDQGPQRSIEEASRVYHDRGSPDETAAENRRKRRASGQIGRWAQRWNWSARARAWDEELERVRRQKQVEAVAEMAERHVKEALMLQNKAVQRLRQLRPEELKPRDALSYLVESVKLERLARGEPTERVAEEHSFSDLQELSDDELARIVAGGQVLPPPGSRGAAAPQDGPQEPV